MGDSVDKHRVSAAAPASSITVRVESLISHSDSPCALSAASRRAYFLGQDCLN